MDIEMGGVIEITEPQWERLHQRLRQDYANEPSVILIRAKMRRVLGFTVRRHREWVTNVEGSSWRQPRDRILLDFFDPALQAWFMLKYGEYVDG